MLGNLIFACKENKTYRNVIHSIAILFFLQFYTLYTVAGFRLRSNCLHRGLKLWPWLQKHSVWTVSSCAGAHTDLGNT